MLLLYLLIGIKRVDENCSICVWSEMFYLLHFHSGQLWTHTCFCSHPVQAESTCQSWRHIFLKLTLSDTCELSLGMVMFPDCIHFMTLTHFFIIIIVYTFLETLLSTIFITTLFNGIYIIMLFFGSKKVAFLALIVLF